MENKILIRVNPKGERAKKEVNKHGSIFVSKSECIFGGIPAILCRSADCNWAGWFNRNEADWEYV